MKRFLSSLLVLCMAMTFLPASAAAASVSPFGDVQSTDWYYDEVQYVYENGLMSGTSATTFSPDATTTRGMIVTILHRLEGTPAVSTSGTFADVTAGRYYTDAVEWASANGIVGGYGNGRFGPNDPITREQMAAILYRYAAYKEYDVSGAADLSGYSDASSISSYARIAMQWANHSGLVNGTSGATLSPQGSATRAQVAVILYRFCEEVLGGIETEGEFTVTFKYNYGSKGTYETVKVDAGETVEKPKNPTRSGYDFDGWYTKTTGGTKFDFDDAIIADLTLYAHWSGNSGGGSSGGSSHRHSYIGTVTTQPTCTTEGVKTYTCSCGDSYTEAIPATGHSYAETVLKAATCQEAGEKYEVCSACGAVQNSVEIPALGHKWDEGKLTQAATCSSTGIMTYTCDNCGGTYTQEIERADHTWGAWETSAASCVTDEQTRTCAVCGSIERRSESGTGSHNWNDWSHDESANTHSRTCQTTGCTAAETAICTFDDWTPDPDDSSKHVHNCQICRYSESVGHIWGEMVLDTETYVGTYTCAACGAKKAETYVASVGAVYYTDLSSAIAAAEDGDAVVLLADAENVDLTISKAIILNTNGRTLTGTLAYAAVENVKLTSVGDGLTVKIGDKTAAFEADTAGGLMVVKSAADESGNLDIYTLEGLQDFANAVDKGTTYKNLTVTLMDHIDLSDVENWNPIGDGSHSFQGVFDGNEKTISNLTIDRASETNVGLFGFTTDGEVKDLTISNASVKGYLNVGVVAGTPYTSKYTNLTLTGSIQVEGYAYVGGMLGKNAYAPLTDLTINASQGSYVKADSEYYRTYVGGVAGFMGEGGVAVKNVTSNIDVYGTTSDVGGIVGIAHYNNSFENCACSGNVYLTGPGNTDHSSSSDAYEIGGIAGVWHNQNNTNVTLANCSYTGTLSSYDVVTKTNVTDFYYNGLVGAAYSTAGTGKLIVDGKDWTENGIVYDEAASAYGIYSVAGLKTFRDNVNNGAAYSGMTVTLMSDIDLNNEMWTPIGRNADSSNKFQGTFDGSGKTISHLTVEAAVEYGATGFFGALNGTARNFTLDGVTIDSVSYGAASGSTSNGIAAVAGSIYNSGSIEGVTVKNATIHGNRYVGGIAGYVYGQIKNCTVENSTISATPDNLTGSYDNGDKVGGIAGYLGEGSNTVSGNAVKDVNLSAYRDVGGIVGCAQNETAVSGNMVFHAHITADQQTNFYGAKDVNASYEVGRNLGAAVSGNDVSEAEGSMTLKLPESYADSLTLTGSTTLVGAANGSRIAPSTEGESAIVINGTVMLTVKGSITAAGATGGDGIEVPSGSSLELTGDTLTALGNGGTDGENNSGKYGSGIGNAKDTVGSIYIHDMLSLTAEGYGNHAFGIGGNMTGTLKIEGTAIAYAKGGWVKSVCDEDDTWHKKSPEGGAAIGIGLSATSNTIILNNTTVKRAEGGAKSAAIGGQYWSNPVIEIDGCTLTNIQGGTDSAGVGGSRINANGYTSTITINDSTVEAKGGCYGAGIGSGYNGYTNEAANHLTTIYITGDSKIVAVGGTAAAGIGTGHHAYMLAGAIDASVNTTGTKAGDPAVVELQGYWNEDPTAWCTSAMDIGYGSLDQTREGKLLDVVFTIGGNMIENPVSDAE